MVRRLVLLVVLAGALLAPASAGAVVVGFGDQKPDMFLDERFGRLGIKHARIAVPWDWRQHAWKVEQLDRWFALARERGVRPLVSFGHGLADRRALPPPTRLKYEVRQFRRRWPQVRDFATWNEANHCGQPTCHRPRLVAAYWRKIRQACPRCRVLAAELLDLPNVVAWAKAFRRHAWRPPTVWGLHNYIEANRFRSTYLRRFLAQVPGRVWLTEVGGIVKRRGTRTTQANRVKGIPESVGHAARVTRFLFRRVLPLSRRITRVYLYHWNAATPWDSWDSAFVGWRHEQRPALRVLRRQLALLRARRR